MSKLLAAGRLLLVLALVASATTAFSAGNDSRIDTPHTVNENAYGEVLFEYYQDRYFAAITRSLVALERGEVQQQKQRAEVLLGSLYLRYGVLGEAEILFNRLIKEAVDSNTAGQAWYYLARLYYLRNEKDRAWDILNNKIRNVPDEILQDYYILRARLLMDNGEYTEAARQLQALDSASLSNAYTKFNFAVTMLRAGDHLPSIQLLTDVVNLPDVNEEFLALKDRAALALGYHFLRTGRAAEAERVLNVVRLNGPFSDAGLLLHGWSRFAQDDSNGAITPWAELAQRSVENSFVQEAKLALPFAVEGLGSDQKAVRGFQEAIRSYTVYLRELVELEEKIESENWFGNILENHDLSSAMDSPTLFFPGKVEGFGIFLNLFSSNEFQQAYKNYHELSRLLTLNNSWQIQLPAFHGMIDNQTEKYRRLIPEVENLLVTAEDMDFEEKQQLLSSSVEHCIRQNDWLCLADERERSIAHSLDVVESLIARWPDRVTEETREKVDFYRGILKWRVAESIGKRRWQKESAARSNAGLLDDYEERKEGINEAIAMTRNRYAGFKESLVAEQQELEALYARGEALQERYRKHIEALALREIAFQKDHIRDLLAHAFFSIGEIQDRSWRDQSHSRKGEDGGKQTAVDATITVQ